MKVTLELNLREMHRLVEKFRFETDGNTEILAAAITEERRRGAEYLQQLGATPEERLLNLIQQAKPSA